MGSAGIARKNWEAISNAHNATLVAVASRHEDRAATWIGENQAEVAFDPIPEAVGGYENLLSRDDVDAVYIPLPTGLRKDWVLKAAEAGKHVLCEKPCGMSVADLKEMIAACEQAGVQFMDGVMFMHSDRLQRMREILDDGESVGTLKRIATQFSFLGDDDFLGENIRTHSALEPFGALGDLGWYNIRIALWAKGYELPAKVTGRILSSSGQDESPDRVPTEFSAEMIWEDGVSASLYCSFLTEHQQWFHISGTKGSMISRDYVLPYAGEKPSFATSSAVFDQNGCHFEMKHSGNQIEIEESPNNAPDAQETKLFANFSSLVLGGKPDPFWPDVALKTQIVLETCLASARDGGAEVAISV